MKKILFTLLFVTLIVCSVSPDFVFTAGNGVTATVSSGASLGSCSSIVGSGFSGIVSCILGFLNVAIYIILSAAVVYTVYGAFMMMQEGKREEGKNVVLYGIFGIFVMVSIWGLVNILDSTFKLSGQSAIKPPELYRGQ